MIMNEHGLDPHHPQPQAARVKPPASRPHPPDRTRQPVSVADGSVADIEWRLCQQTRRSTGSAATPGRPCSSWPAWPNGSKHGYALTKDIESFAGVRVAPGTLYEALARLQAQGLIEPVESHDRRRPYRLTEVGAATLQAQLDAQRRVADVGLRRLAQGWGLT